MSDRMAQPAQRARPHRVYCQPRLGLHRLINPKSGITSEFHEIWVTYETIRDVDAEIVSWFTSALPRHKGQAPRSIVVRCCCRGGRCQQNRCSHVDKGKVLSELQLTSF